MAGQPHMIEIIHAGPAEMLVGYGESGRLDERRIDAETGAEPQHGPRVLRNVGLEEGEAKRRFGAGDFDSIAARRANVFARRRCDLSGAAAGLSAKPQF